MFHRPKIVVAVCIGYSRGHDRLRACSLARRRDLRRYGTMPLHTCPCRYVIPLLAGGNQDEVPSVGMLRPTCSVCPFTAIRKYCCLGAFWTATLYETACSVVVDVYGLLSKTRSFEGVLASPEKKFATVRRHASPYLSLPVCQIAAGRR